MNSELISKYKWHLFSFLIGLAAGVVICYGFGPQRTQHHYTERIIEREVPVVKETVKYVNTTDIAYVPKATVTEERLDPVTGKSSTVTVKEKTDVDVQIEKPKINVSLNGQPYAFSLLEGEHYKFDQGKISLRQESMIGVELAVKPQIIDHTKTGGIDLFVGRYFGVGLQFRRIGLDIGTDGRNQDFRLRWRAVEW